jgi:hypothetical protein
VPIHKRLFRPISAFCSKFYPRNITYTPMVKFFACFDRDQNSSFLDGHYLFLKLSVSILVSLRCKRVNRGLGAFDSPKWKPFGIAELNASATPDAFPIRRRYRNVIFLASAASSAIAQLSFLTTTISFITGPARKRICPTWFVYQSFWSF